jgi:hypothetical protein
VVVNIIVYFPWHLVKKNSKMCMKALASSIMFSSSFSSLHLLSTLWSRLKDISVLHV